MEGRVHVFISYSKAKSNKLYVSLYRWDLSSFCASSCSFLSFGLAGGAGWRDAQDNALRPCVLCVVIERTGVGKGMSLGEGEA